MAKDAELIQKELSKTHDRLSELPLRLLFSAEERFWRNQEKKLETIYIFLGLSITIPGVVFPIVLSTSDLVSDWTKLGVTLLLTASLFGIALVLYSNQRDSRDITTQGEAEQKYLNQIVDAHAKDVYYKAIKGSITEEDIEKFELKKDSLREEYKKEIEQLSKTREAKEKLGLIFLVLFLVGFVIATLSILLPLLF